MVELPASVAGLAGYVYVLGGIVSWAHLSSARLPADNDTTTAVLDDRVASR